MGWKKVYLTSPKATTLIAVIILRAYGLISCMNKFNCQFLSITVVYFANFFDPFWSVISLSFINLRVVKAGQRFV